MIFLAATAIFVSGCASQVNSLTKMVDNALPSGEVGDDIKYGKDFSFNFNPFADYNEDEMYAPKNVSPNKLAFENTSGLCDINKLPAKTVPLRFDSFPPMDKDKSGLALSLMADCELRYIFAAKSKRVPQLNQNELAFCATQEYLLKMVVEGKHTEVRLPSNTFEIKKIVDKFTPMIEARIKLLRNANQYCISPRPSSIAIKHYNLDKGATPIAFSGLAEMRYNAGNPAEKVDSSTSNVAPLLPLANTRTTGVQQLTERVFTGKYNSVSSPIYSQTSLHLDQSEPSFSSEKGGQYKMYFKTNPSECGQLI